MKRKHIKKLNFIIICLLIITSCKKEADNEIPPNIWLKTGTAYVSSDTVIAVGDWFQFGIHSEKGSANITNLVIKKIINGIEQTYLDSGLNSGSLDVDKLYIKGNDINEKWTFIAMDKNRKRSSVSLRIEKDTASVYGSLIKFPEITLGAQQNIDTGSFFNIHDTLIYFLHDAYNNQEKIDILYYFYSSDENSISSPGANIEAGIFTGSYALNNWTIRNETRFLQVPVTTQDFDQMQDDSLLIALYSPPDAKRKAKNLLVDNIYFFLTSDNLLGAFKVLNVDGTDAGSIKISVIIQQQ